MRDETPAIDPDIVLSHTEWLRSLARSLAGGEGDDLAQATWTAALASDGATRGNLRGWLRAIARNLHRRRGGRRAERSGVEAEGARAEAEEPTDDMVSRAELQGRLVAEVMALPEHYRDAVLLRFFEGLAPEEIARRTGVPASTVRSRLVRARERLRDRLDDRFGGRHAWVLLVAPPSGTGTTVLETALMTLQTKLVIAAVVVAGAGALWVGVLAPEAAEPRLARVLGPARAATPAASPEVAERPATTVVASEERASREELAVAAPEAPRSAVEPEPAPVLTDGELWRDAENAFMGMLDGSATLDEVVDVAEALLERVEVESARFGRDNAVVFDLLDDPERGSATLSVNPGGVGESDEFELELEMATAPGFAHEADARGGELRLSFGLGEDGVDSCFVLSEAELSWDDDVSARFLERGELRSGGALRFGELTSTWRPQLVQVIDDPELGISHRFRMGEEIEVHAGVLANPRLDALAPRLRALRNVRP